MPSSVSNRADNAARPSEIADFLHSRGYVMCLISEEDGRLMLPEIPISTVESATQIVNVVFVQSTLITERPEVFAQST
jgi:hypothetical protein